MRLPFYILAVGLGLWPTVFAEGISGVSRLPKALFISIAVTGVCLAALTKLLRNEPLRDGQKFSFPFAAIAIGLLAMYSLSSAFFAASLHSTFYDWSRWAFPVLAFFTICLLVPSAKERQLLLLAIAVGSFLNSALVLLQYWLDAAPVFQAAPPAGTFSNKNFAGQIAAIGIPLLLYFLATSRTRRSSIIFATLALVNMLAAFHVFSRNVWLSSLIAIVAVGLYLLLLFRKGEAPRDTQRGKSAITLILFILFAILTNLTPNGFEFRLNDTVANITKTFSSTAKENKPAKILAPSESVDEETVFSGSAQHRISYYKNGWVMFRDALPLGVGEGNFKVLWPLYSRAVDEIGDYTKERNLAYLHNDYLEMLIELGLPGLVLFLSVGVLLILTLTARRDALFQLGSTEQISLLALFPVLVFMIVALFSSPFNFPGHQLYLLTCLGIFFAPTRPDEGMCSLSLRISRSWMKPLGIVGIICVSGLSLSFIFNVQAEIRADRIFFKPYLTALGEKDFTEAERIARAALHEFPQLHEARIGLGGTLLVQKNYEASLAESRKYAVVYPYDYRNNLNIASALTNLGRNEEAIKVYETMLRVVPDDRLAATWAAKLSQRIGDYERAERYMAEYSAAIDHADYGLFLARTAMALKNDNVEKAKRILNDGLTHHPSNPALLKRLRSL